MTQATGYQVRYRDGLNRVYLVKADGEEIPVDRQRMVFQHGSYDRAQVVCDALNNGLLSRVVRAVNVERERNART
jgi:hypothetical protein